MANATRTSEQRADDVRAAGETGRKAYTAYVQAGADLGAQVDRLARSQVGHLTAANKEAADFVGQAVDATLKANEAFRRAGTEWAESAAQSFAG